MSILLLSPPVDVGDAVISRLISEGDDVGVVEMDWLRADRWKALGARVARGSSEDPDLIERAAQNCRTIVLFDVDDRQASSVGAAIEAASRAPVDRLIAVSGGDSTKCLELLRAAGVDYVFLRAQKRRVLRRSGTSALDVAEAVDAADDLSGQPRLELDLPDRDSRRVLGLDG
jgi:Trk K+ transport system NAD-binding subunit